MYNRLHTIPACDGQTDRRTDRQTSCAVKNFHGNYTVVRAQNDTSKTANINRYHSQ